MKEKERARGGKGEEKGEGENERGKDLDGVTVFGVLVGFAVDGEAVPLDLYKCCHEKPSPLFWWKQLSFHVHSREPPKSHCHLIIVVVVVIVTLLFIPSSLDQIHHNHEKGAYRTRCKERDYIVLQQNKAH